MQAWKICVAVFAVLKTKIGVHSDIHELNFFQPLNGELVHFLLQFANDWLEI